MAKKLSTEEFITKAKEVHADLYDYSKVHYNGAYTKVLIIDPDHGEFWQTPTNHLSGQGNPTRGSIKRSSKIELSTEEFITKAKKVHADLYDYSKVQYCGSKTKVLIIDPVHGEFWQTPGGHLHGSGNPNRGLISKRTKQTSNIKEFITKAKEVHGELYDYSKVQYHGSHTKVLIIDPVHGEFWQSPGHHLSGNGNPHRGSINKSTKQTSNIKEFITQAKEVHGELYDYSKVQYYGSKTKVLIIDPVHGEFWQTPTSHLRGSGNPNRAETGYQPNAAGYFYIHEITSRISDKKFYKIGITKNVKQRLRKYNKNVLQTNMFKTFYCADGKVIQELERYIKKDSGIMVGALPKSLYESGYTETINAEDLNSVLNIVHDFMNQHRCGSHIKEVNL